MSGWPRLLRSSPRMSRSLPDASRNSTFGWTRIAFSEVIAFPIHQGVRVLTYLRACNGKPLQCQRSICTLSEHRWLTARWRHYGPYRNNDCQKRHFPFQALDRMLTWPMQRATAACQRSITYTPWLLGPPVGLRLLNLPSLRPSCRMQRETAALCICSFLWSSSAIPLYFRGPGGAHSGVVLLQTPQDSPQQRGPGHRRSGSHVGNAPRD